MCKRAERCCTGCYSKAERKCKNPDWREEQNPADNHDHCVCHALEQG